MSISNFTQLKTSVANWLHRSDLTATVEDFIMLGEWKANRLLRIGAMEADLSVVITSGEATLPADYVQLKYAYVDGSTRGALNRKTSEWISSNFPAGTGRPQTIARKGTKFVFGPYPDSGYTIKGVYYKRFPPLSASSLTNWFTTNAPDLLLYAALLEASPYLKSDSRIPIWQAKFAEALGQVQGESDREELSGGPLVATVR